MLAQLIGQSLFAALILVFVIFFVDQREFNVTERKPYYELANGTMAQVPSKEWYPLQSDITTIISGAFNLLGKCYSAWIAVMTWNYAFLLLEKNGMRLETLGSMISLPAIPILFPPPGFETGPLRAASQHNTRSAKQRLSIGVALVILSSFPASFSSPLLTGSISWQASLRNISDADVLKNVGLGVNGPYPAPWQSWYADMSFRTRFVHRAAALATRAWNSVTDNIQDPPTFKRVIPSLQNLPVGSSLKNVTVPWFNIQSFNWVTRGSDINATLLHFLAVDSTPGVLVSTDKHVLPNPLQSSLRTTTILPDIPYTSFPMNFTWTMPQPVKLENRTGIVAVNIDSYQRCNQTEFGELPLDIYIYTAPNVWDVTECFVFAHITYSAGAAICSGCRVVFPLVVESPPATELALEGDIMTPHAMYVMADVIAELVDSNITLPSQWNNMENYTREMLMRGYTSAWTAMSEMVAFYSLPYPSTSVTIPVTMSRAFIDRRRVWGWLVLQGVAFAGGAAFLVHVHGNHEYPIANPLLRGFMLDIDMPDDEKEVVRDHMGTWPEGFKDTFIKWERERDRSAFTVKGPLQPVRFVDTSSVCMLNLWDRRRCHCIVVYVLVLGNPRHTLPGPSSLFLHFRFVLLALWTIPRSH